MARTATARRRRRDNMTGYIIFAVVILMIAVVMYIQGLSVKAKIATYSAIESQLDAQIAAEHERAEEIAEFEKYAQTKAYAQEQAQEKLGLVKPGEIIFRRE